MNRERDRPGGVRTEVLLIGGDVFEVVEEFLHLGMYVIMAFPVKWKGIQQLPTGSLTVCATILGPVTWPCKALRLSSAKRHRR